jgi:RNA polymerase sigma-70 factor (ECF subfamily)
VFAPGVERVGTPRSSFQVHLAGIILEVVATTPRFPETHWSMLLRLRTEDGAAHREILQKVFHEYWRPTYHYLRALVRVSDEEAEDLVQEFFTTLIARNAFERSDPERGSFRSFLKTSLRNFVVSNQRAAAARPRLVPLAPEAAREELDSSASPDEAFDREWARGLLRDAVERFRQEATAAGREAQVRIFEAYCLSEEALTYDEVARRLDVSADDVRNRLREARQRIRDILRQMLAGSLDAGEDLKDQLELILSR